MKTADERKLRVSSVLLAAFSVLCLALCVLALYWLFTKTPIKENRALSLENEMLQKTAIDMRKALDGDDAAMETKRERDKISRLTEEMSAEFPELEQAKLLPARIEELEASYQILFEGMHTRRPMYFDTKLPETMDKDWASRLGNTLSGWMAPILGLGTNNEIVYDQIMKTQIAAPVDLLCSYYYEYTDCYDQVETLKKELFSKLSALSEQSAGLNEAPFIVQEYRFLAEAVEQMQLINQTWQFQELYLALHKLLNITEHLESCFPILIHNGASEYQSTLRKDASGLRAMITGLENQYGFSLTEQEKQALLEKRKGFMQAYVQLFYELEGHLDDLRSYFLISGSTLDTYVNGKGAVQIKSYLKNDSIALIRQISHKNFAENVFSYLFYDADGIPFAIIGVGDVPVEIYLSQGEILFSSVDNPALFVESAQWMRDIVTEYTAGSYSEQNHTESRLKKEYEEYNLF